MATDAKDKGSVTGRNKDEQEEEGKQEQETLIIETEEELRALIENNVSLENKTIRGLPPLLYATSLCDEDLACHIVNKGVGVDCNVRHDYGYRPLHYACEYGMVNLVKAILINMKNKTSDDNGFSEFLNNTRTIDLQLQMKNIQGGGKTFLHFAALASEPKGCDVVRILIDEYAAKRTVVDWNDNTPAILAAMRGHKRTLALLAESKGKGDNYALQVKYTGSWLAKKRKKDLQNGNERVRKMWAIPDSLRTPYKLKKHFTFDECDYLLNEVLRYTDSNGWLDDRHRGYATTDVRVSKMPQVEKWLQTRLRDHLFPILARSHHFSIDTFKFRDLFFVYYNAGSDADFAGAGKPRQRSVGIHRDGSVISFNVLLNSEKDFEGGGTFFEADGAKLGSEDSFAKMEGVYGRIYQICRGDVLVHSGKVRHGGYEITHGKRMLLVGFVDAGDYTPLDLHFQDHH